MNETLRKTLEKEGYTNIRYIKGRGYCGIFRFVFTTGLVIGMDYAGYSGRYCYENASECKKALEEWDGEGDPSGDWIKYKGVDGERSNMNNLMG